MIQLILRLRLEAREKKLVTQLCINLCLTFLSLLLIAAAGLPPGSAGYPMAPYVINPQEPYALIPAGKNSQLSSV
jgi:hypothetical protein